MFAGSKSRITSGVVNHCVWHVLALTMAAQILDPSMSPSLTSLAAVDIVRRYNACVTRRSSQAQPQHVGGTPVSSNAVVDNECKTLEAIVKKIVNKYPRAPTMEQRCCLVTLAAMENMEIVLDVVNTLGSQITAATAVRQEQICGVWMLQGWFPHGVPWSLDMGVEVKSVRCRDVDVVPVIGWVCCDFVVGCVGRAVRLAGPCTGHSTCSEYGDVLCSVQAAEVSRSEGHGGSAACGWCRGDS